MPELRPSFPVSQLEKFYKINFKELICKTFQVFFYICENIKNKNMKLQIIPDNLYEKYKKKCNINLFYHTKKIIDKEYTNFDFKFYRSLSTIYSSKIEGEPIEVDTYVKYKTLGTNLKKDVVSRVDGLYDAYKYVQSHALNLKNVLKTHEMILNTPEFEDDRGKIRDLTMYVMNNENVIIYIASDKKIVEQETKKLFADIETLRKQNLSLPEAFFYASLIHLIFVNIHPFVDGNGRSARLLEKWFLAEKTAPEMWFLKSEAYYYKNIHSYYGNLIKTQKKNYKNIDYQKSIPFLLMLAESTKQKM